MDGPERLRVNQLEILYTLIHSNSPALTCLQTLVGQFSPVFVPVMRRTDREMTRIYLDGKDFRRLYPYGVVRIRRPCDVSVMQHH